MDETESEYNARLLLKAAEYYSGHLKVVANYRVVMNQMFNIHISVLTNNKILESMYNEKGSMDVITILSVR